MNYFDGKKIREELLAELKREIEAKGYHPGLAVITIGDDPVCLKYVALKKKFADQIGIDFYEYTFGSNNSQDEIVGLIERLNSDEKINGIMIQMPILDKFNKQEIIKTISPSKDVDGLRFCCSFGSDFKPPVVLAILKAIKLSGQELSEKKTVVAGRGFLVGGPLIKSLEAEAKELIVVDSSTEKLTEITGSADILISAVGKAGIVKPEMIKEGVVLIDAGTAEVSGELKGDIDPLCYDKSSYYTPVPGGIGPVTVAMLMKNVVNK